MPRSEVSVRLRPKHEVTADAVELHFKDAYVTRADSWRIASGLIGQCLYVGQRIVYYDSLRLYVGAVYRKGHKAFSAYIGPHTRLVYRSESSRYIFFIQMASDMWNFEENGDIMFHKLVNSLLPEVFRRWRDMDAHHVMSVVLFTSIDVSKDRQKLGQGQRPAKTEDYYRVVIDQVHTSRWSDIMATLRYEFERFARDVLLDRNTGNIRGRVLPAVKGNMMEAISFATSLVSSKFYDRDLRRTNLQVEIITPGTGIFDVDYDLLYQTSAKLLSIEIGIDIFCLSRPPLHVTPLFRYIERGTNKIVNVVPSWLDISFWSSNDSKGYQWIPRSKIYDIQMMGLMENDVSAISIDHLQWVTGKKQLADFMNTYDNNIYKSKAAIANQRLIDEAINSAASSTLLRPKVSTTTLRGDMGSRDPIRSVSKGLPANAIISSPIADAGASSSALLANTIKSKSRISALTSLLSLGGGGGTGNTQSPATSRTNSPTVGPVSPKASISKLKDFEFLGSLSRKNSLVNMRSRASTLNGASSQLERSDKSQDQLRTPNMPIRQSPAPELSVSPTHSPKSSRLLHPSKASTSPQNPGWAGSAEHHTRETLERNNYMWVVVDNPANTGSEGATLNITNYGRWRNVFPKGVKRKAVKWRSLRSPASLPLATEIFPSVEDFFKNYTFQTYDVSLDPENGDHATLGELFGEMVGLRLHIGFQIVVGDRVSKVENQSRLGGNAALIVQTLPKDYFGIRIYMTRSNQIHRLSIDHSGNINVQLYTKVETNTRAPMRNYHPFVRARFDAEYTRTPGNFFDPSVRLINWNILDQQLAGYTDVGLGSEQMLFKVRFILVPAHVTQKTILSKSEGSDSLTAEEVRLEGLRRVIAMLHRGKYLSREEKKLRGQRRKEQVAPDIKFYTGDLGAFLQQMYEEYNMQDESQTLKSGSLRTKESLFAKSSERLNRAIKLGQLASEMQGEKGIRLVDRRWHWKTHKNCFVGQEFVAWIIDSFTDIDTSEAAVEYGSHLMNAGLFHHVENRHGFLNGHYFYQLDPQYVIDRTQSQKGWFGLQKSGTATTLGSGNGPKRSETSSLTGTEAATESKKPPSVVSRGSDRSAAQKQPAPGALPRILLSRSFKYDLDPAGRGRRPEYLTVHVDRVHNPQNAFHLRFEWINATPKLIDDAIVGISRMSEQYGLRLVQVPLDEISSLPNDSPFSSLVSIQFSVDPAVTPWTDTRVSDPLADDPHFYHKFYLERMGFVLDMDAVASLISKDFDIEYSWGKPYYNFAQYVHTSGTVIGQVTTNGAFVFYVNTIHLCRINAASGTGTVSSTNRAPQQPTEVIQSLRSVAQDSRLLSDLFEEARRRWLGSKLDLDATEAEVGVPCNYVSYYE